MGPIYGDSTILQPAVPDGDRIYRWLAPEFVDPPRWKRKEDPESKAGDVFAFGMVGVEVFTGRAPFYESTAMGVLIITTRGDRPERPEEAKELTEEIWELLCLCWKHSSWRRPTMKNVLRDLKALVEGDGVSSANPSKLLISF